MAEDKDDSSGSNPFGGWWLAAATMVAVVVLGAGYVIVRGQVNGDTSSAASTPSTQVTAPAVDDPSPADGAGSTEPTNTAPQGWPDGGCNGHRGAAAVPEAGPKVTWEPLGGMSVPESKTLGPTRNKGGLRQCYEHSPSGALMAGVNILSAASTKPARVRTVLTAQMTPGTGREQTIAEMTNSNSGPGSGQPAGFDIGACTPSRCQVNVATNSGGMTGLASLTMVWTHGDWYIDGAGTGIEPNIVSGLPEGYTPWGP